MNFQSEEKSCAFCLWSDQCGGDKPCNDFDCGNHAKLPSDAAIETRIEKDREEYREAFEKYIDGSYNGKFDYFSIRSLDEIEKIEKGCD